MSLYLMYYSLKECVPTLILYKLLYTVSENTGTGVIQDIVISLAGYVFVLLSYYLSYYVFL